MFFIVFVKKLAATARIFVLNWKVHLLVISSVKNNTKKNRKTADFATYWCDKMQNNTDLKVVFEKVVMVLLRFLHSSV